MHAGRVGLHLRLYTTVSAVARTAKALRLNFFQFFLQYEDIRRPFFLSVEDEKIFLSMRLLFKSIYIHGSYLINMATDRQLHPVLQQEIALAKRLHVTHYILHPGTIEKGANRNVMLERVVRVLNNITVQHPELIFCIENTANPSALLGSTLEDLIYIQERIVRPENITFCIDTAHAHAAGYDLSTAGSRESFFGELIKHKIPVALIHLNDTQEKRGSYVDCHARLGEGILGADVLHSFCSHSLIRDIPLIVESPELSFDMMKQLLHKTKQW